jgi:LAO/AO transport system kinase
VTGVPGVGKSSFIETLGMRLIEQGRRVAVLAVDPSSAVTGGSILGDKTRMERLAQRTEAFIRPSPSASSLGGVARRTREAMWVCEAAGFDVVLVETVGVGQSETTVADMVDFFLVLMLPGAGDELQGIKRGILELADVIAVNKCDGDNAARARIAQQEYAAALRYLRPRGTWQPTAVRVSALTGEGMDALWQTVLAHHDQLAASGELERLRQGQRARWMWSMVEEGVMAAFHAHPAVQARTNALVEAVSAGTVTPVEAARELLAAFQEQPPKI